MKTEAQLQASRKYRARNRERLNAEAQLRYRKTHDLTVGRPLLDRFMEKVSPEPNSGCWLWFGGLLPNGYGTYGNRKTKEEHSTHRLSWKLLRGPIPEAMHVLHKCDVRSCVNPDHLFLGTPRDNVDDMVARGRSQRGSKHHNASLSEEDVRGIKGSSELGTVLAKRYGVTPANICSIKNGRSWRHI